MLGSSLGGTFTRVPTSGAFIGGINAARKKALSVTQTKIYKGDIICPDHLSKLVIECKNYEEFRFHQLLQPGACKQLDHWIKQTLDVIDGGDVMLVAFKITRIGWFVALPEKDCDDYTFKNHCVYEGIHGRFRITDLAEFLQNNHTSIIKKAT